METLEAIFTRRSIRSYTGQPVAPEHVELLLRAAMAAPSAGNQQAWEFVVVDDRHVLDAIPTVHPYAAMCSEAALVIAVCADVTRERYQGFWIQDCCAATQNLLLAAHDLGLGAVWLGIDPGGDRSRAIADLLQLPPAVQPLSLVAVGHPRQTREPEDRFQPARIHHNRF